MATITIPYNFVPREYQKGLYNCLSQGFTRGLAVMHRRAGKDKTFVNIVAREAFKRVGSYFYILPYYSQARKIVWEGIDKDGFRLIDHFPKQLVKRKDNQQMTIELSNGSFVRFLGSDNVDSIVGTNPIGVVFSEFSLHKIEAWNFIRPILLENGGWALFNGTPRGKNHMYRLLKAAEQDERWYVDIKTIDDTGVMTAEQVEEEIANGMPRALALQEFYCSFDAAMVGAYYGEAMAQADASTSICSVPWDPTVPVNTAWDLGISDTMVIWLFQQVGSEIRLIDMIQGEGHGLEWYVKRLNELPYAYGYDIFPHDVRARELGTGKSRLDTLHDLGRKHTIIARRVSIEDGIHAARSLIHRCKFDDRKCEKGIEALKQYRASWDPAKECYGAPVHDWASHYADAFRMLAIGLEETNNDLPRPAVAEGTGYDPTRLDEPRYMRQLSMRAQRDERYSRPEFQSAFDY